MGKHTAPLIDKLVYACPHSLKIIIQLMWNLHGLCGSLTLDYERSSSLSQFSSTSQSFTGFHIQWMTYGMNRIMLVKCFPMHLTNVPRASVHFTYIAICLWHIRHYQNKEPNPLFAHFLHIQYTLSHMRNT